MAKSRNEKGEAERREAVLARTRILPAWCRSVGALIEAGAIARFVCGPCRRVYDVDLEALAVLRGRQWSLIGQAARCKASRCRARGFFVVARGPEAAFFSLGRRMPPWLVGASPRDHDPDGGPGGPAGPDGGSDDGIPPCPPGVDRVTWVYASEAERKRLVRRARG